MILKILRYNRKEKTDKQEYWMIDSVRKYSLSTPIRLSHKTYIGDYNAVFFDMPDIDCTCGDDDECDSCMYYNVLICRLDDGSEYSIAFDTVCYVLNDNGKTIEKIVVNN